MGASRFEGVLLSLLVKIRPIRTRSQCFLWIHTHTPIDILTVKRILANHLLSVFVFVVNGFNKHTKSTNIRFKGLSLFLRWTLTMSSRADGWAFVMLAWVRKTHALLWFATTQAGATTTITTSHLHNIKFALHATLNNKKN